MGNSTFFRCCRCVRSYGGGTAEANTHFCPMLCSSFLRWLHTDNDDGFSMVDGVFGPHARHTNGGEGRGFSSGFAHELRADCSKESRVPTCAIPDPGRMQNGPLPHMRVSDSDRAGATRRYTHIRVQYVHSRGASCRRVSIPRRETRPGRSRRTLARPWSAMQHLHVRSVCGSACGVRALLLTVGWTVGG